MNLSILTVDWTLAFQLGNFLILLFFLKKFLYKPVTEMFETRKQEVESNLLEAETAKNSANELKAQYSDKIKLARTEAEKIVSTATQVATKKSDEIIQSAEEKVKKLEEKSRQEVELEKKKAFDEIKGEISDIALLIASKVIEKEMKEEDHKKLIDTFIDTVGEDAWQN